MRTKHWEEGFAAYGSVDVRDNPYHPSTPQGEEWTDGWLAAQKLEEQ